MDDSWFRARCAARSQLHLPLPSLSFSALSPSLAAATAAAVTPAMNHLVNDLNYGSLWPISWPPEHCPHLIGRQHKAATMAPLAMDNRSVKASFSPLPSPLLPPSLLFFATLVSLIRAWCVIVGLSILVSRQADCLPYVVALEWCSCCAVTAYLACLPRFGLITTGTAHYWLLAQFK